MDLRLRDNFTALAVGFLIIIYKNDILFIFFVKQFTQIIF
jgi:hypothetical protein